MVHENIENRQLILENLKAELFGPSPHGKEIDCTKPIHFPDKESSYGPWRQLGSQEEILQRDSPTKRYGIGVLYPWQLANDNDEVETAGLAAVGMHGKSERDELNHLAGEEVLTRTAVSEIEKALKRSSAQHESDDLDLLAELDLTAANVYKPSSMGITFLAQLTPKTKIVVEGVVGRYEPIKVQVEDRTYTWWIRIPIEFSKEFDVKELMEHASYSQPVRGIG